MKTKLIYAILASLALMSFNNCSGEPAFSGDAGSIFRLNALIRESRTLFDPGTLKVSWSPDDELAILAGDVQNGGYGNFKFTRSSGDSYFTCDGMGPSEFTGKELCILYPYNAGLTGIDGDGFGDSPVEIGTMEGTPLVQNAPDDASHISSPLYGHVDNVAGASVNVQMKHVCTIMEVSLNNTGSEAADIAAIELSNDSGELLSGKFNVNFISGETRPAGDGEAVTMTTLEISEGGIRPGECGKFYISCPEFSIPEGGKLTFSVRTSEGESRTYTKTAPSGGWDFKAGTINRTSFDMGKEAFYTEVSCGLENWEGDYLITYTDENSINVLNSWEPYGQSTADLASVMTEDGIPAEEGDKYKAIVEMSGSGYTIHVSGIGYIGYSGSGNTLSKSEIPSEGTDIWDISYDGAICLSPMNAADRKLLWNSGAPRFACYTSAQKGLTLYRRTLSGETISPEPGPVAGGNTNGWLANNEVPYALVDMAAGAEYSSTVDESYEGAKAYIYNCKDPDKMIVTHTFTENGKVCRNYTLLFDRTKKASVWVAFPMHKSVWDGSAGRNDSWKDDPAIPSTWQSRGCSSPYSRGHQIASGDRQVNVTANKQTFYHSNQAPQWQNGFNGGIWSSLEQAIQNNAPSGRDTMYVATGPLFEEGTTITDKEGIAVPLPVGYWKCVMLCSFDEKGQMTGAKGIGYLFPKNGSYSGSYSNYSVTIDEIEELTGFDLFANVPDSLQTAAEKTTTALF